MTATILNLGRTISVSQRGPTTSAEAHLCRLSMQTYSMQTYIDSSVSPAAFHSDSIIGDATSSCGATSSMTLFISSNAARITKKEPTGTKIINPNNVAKGNVPSNRSMRNNAPIGTIKATSTSRNRRTLLIRDGGVGSCELANVYVTQRYASCYQRHQSVVIGKKINPSSFECGADYSSTISDRANFHMLFGQFLLSTSPTV